MIILKSLQHNNRSAGNTATSHFSGTPGFLLLSTVLLCLSLSSPLAAEPVTPGTRDRCPICGMFVAPYPDWLAQIEFKDGSREFFDGPKDMFRFFLLLPENNSIRSREDIAAIYVTEYYSTKMMQADKLFFVINSDVYGPMGKELIPIHTMEAAETFKRDHRANAVVTFDQVTRDMLSDND
ncbi:MAG: nitrous oxide reductase accessory protein NosL [Proteobacteria bacterium]|nr:nitrous oxide reductase accessory protein NosL [Pseudomonadota bacterium]